jgi:uncharacterized protein (DUF2267 family)
MDFVEFLERVREISESESQEEAENIIRATFETLGERIYRTKREDLAAQLPKELKEFLFLRVDGEVTRRHTDRFLLEEFYNRVSARADIGFPQAVKGSKAVMAALQEAVTEGVLAKIREVLPKEFDDLFHGPTG